MADLKPCPFCGGEAALPKHSTTTIQCTGCPASITVSMHPGIFTGYEAQKRHELAQAVEAWNRRADDALIASLRQQLAEAREDGELLDALVSNSWDLRCISVPTGGDDYDIDWLIIEHHQAEPHERTIAQAYKDDPRAAILRAMRATDPNAERCVSCDEVLHDGDSVYHEHGEGGHIHSWCVDDPDSFVDEDGDPASSKPAPFAYSALSHPDREGERE